MVMWPNFQLTNTPHHLHLRLEVGVLSKGMIESVILISGAFIPAYSYRLHKKHPIILIGCFLCIFISSLTL